MKICTNGKCGKELPATDEFFNKAKTGKYGLRGDCKACCNKQAKQYYLANRRRRCEQTIAWQKDHSNEVAKYKARWYERNLKREREKGKQKYRKNRERELARSKRYAKDHPDKINAYTARYRTRKVDNKGSHTGKEFRALCEFYNNTCLCCTKKLPLTADHIVPVIKGGSNNISNIQPLCQSCNSSKGTKIIDYRPFNSF